MGVTTIRKVGVLGVEAGTSHIAGQWGPAMNPLPGETRRTGMVMTHVWGKERHLAEEFGKRYGIANVVDRPEQMLGQVDGVVQSGYRASYWPVELVKPFLEAGLLKNVIPAALADARGSASYGIAKNVFPSHDREGVVPWFFNGGA